MRWRVFVAAILLVTASQSATAQIAVDMNQVTCGKWLGYSAADRDFIRYWMSGYYNGVANVNIVYYDNFKRNTAKITAWCKANKAKSLPTAIANVIGL